MLRAGLILLRCMVGVIRLQFKIWPCHEFRKWSVFPKSMPLTTEVPTHLAFFTVRNSVNILLIKQIRVLLPTLPAFSPIFLRLLSRIALHFRTFCYRLTRTYPTSGWLRRGYRACRVICASLSTVRPFVEVTIDVSPPLQRPPKASRRTIGSKDLLRKPIRLNYFDTYG